MVRPGNEVCLCRQRGVGANQAPGTRKGWPLNCLANACNCCRDRGAPDVSPDKLSQQPQKYSVVIAIQQYVPRLETSAQITDALAHASRQTVKHTSCSHRACACTAQKCHGNWQRKRRQKLCDWPGVSRACEYQLTLGHPDSTVLDARIPSSPRRSLSLQPVACALCARAQPSTFVATASAFGPDMCGPRDDNVQHSCVLQAMLHPSSASPPAVDRMQPPHKACWICGMLLHAYPLLAHSSSAKRDSAHSRGDQSRSRQSSAWSRHCTFGSLSGWAGLPGASSMQACAAAAVGEPGCACCPAKMSMARQLPPRMRSSSLSSSSFSRRICAGPQQDAHGGLESLFPNAWPTHRRGVINCSESVCTDVASGKCSAREAPS